MGKYVNANLIKNEKVEFETTYHWIIFCNIKAALTLFIIPLVAKHTDEFVITNKRIIIKMGLLSRRTLEMNLSKIESVNFHQSIIGRILGFGTIQIIGTGGTKEIIPSINHPLQFRKKFQELA